ncbi:AAA family ATPase [Symbioplanes lichenis]|uniref:AAA family ATPase n=1 Tax=Symbioplanes lichenis TaxID=1629072 RepID=UPI0027393D56|nr:ATP-binding protein [Actinoplanes lichenis]
MVLAVFAGLPGVGKSTLARQVGAALPAAVLGVDAVDAALRVYDVSEPRPGHAAYGVVAALAETQLTLGLSVIIDAVNPVAATRRMWTELAERLDVPLRVVEVVCGDEDVLRRRRSSRGETGGGPVEYEPYLGPRIVVDTHLAVDPVLPVVEYLRK